MHPATVHFPIAFLGASNALKLLYGSTLYFGNPFFSASKQNLGTLSILAYASNVLGIVTVIPTLLTGSAELYAMVSTPGLYRTDEGSGEKRLIPKVGTTLLHVTFLSFIFHSFSLTAIPIVLRMGLALTLVSFRLA